MQRWTRFDPPFEAQPRGALSAQPMPLFVATDNDVPGAQNHGREYRNHSRH